MALKRFGLTNL
jgi:hypothetical protein